MRIAIAGISHEALNTSPLLTKMEHFQVWRGQDLLQGRKPVLSLRGGGGDRGC